MMKKYLCILAVLLFFVLNSGTSHACTGVYRKRSKRRRNVYGHRFHTGIFKLFLVFRAILSTISCSASVRPDINYFSEDIMMKRLFVLILSLMLLCTVGVSAAQAAGPGGNRGMRGGAGGGVDKSGDAGLQSMITDVVPKFQLLTFEDADASLQYFLYVPENYDESKSYPLVQFIPDSSVVGKEAVNYLTQGWGGLIWATDEEQAKHPSFVVVPIFTETIVDDNFNHSAQIDVAMRLLQSLTENYSIDKDKIYTTGQSMGGMTSFHLSTAYPDFFAAYLFVGSQWDVSLLKELEQKDFFYIVSAGDPKASAGQGLRTVMASGAHRTAQRRRTPRYPLCLPKETTPISSPLRLGQHLPRASHPEAVPVSI